MKDKKVKNKPTKYEKWFNKLHFVKRTIFKWVFPYKMHGCVRKYNDGAVLFVGNHFSVFDVVFPALCTDKPIHYFAKDTLNKGVMGVFVRKCESILVKRDGSDVGAVKLAMKYLKNGEHVSIFPEGTRNRSYDDLLPFHGGAVALSIKTRTPIVPIAIIRKIRKFRRTDVVFGEPIEFKKYYGKKLTAEDMEKCENELRDIIKNMRLAFIEKNKVKLGKI